MAKLELVNGVARMRPETGGGVAIYDETIEIVSGAAGAGQLTGPINAGTPVTLPNSKTYTGDELEVYLDGNRLVKLLDYTFNSTTTVAFTFKLQPDDIIRFRIDRTP